MLPFIGCDTKSDNINDQIVNKTQKTIPEKRIKKEIDFKLSDKNVMEFFLEYDKHNKENKVRIYTDFGNIEIELFRNTKFHRSNFIYVTKKNYLNFVSKFLDYCFDNSIDHFQKFQAYHHYQNPEF